MLTSSGQAPVLRGRSPQASITEQEDSLTRKAGKRRRNGGKGRCLLSLTTTAGPGVAMSQARASDGGLWLPWLLMLDKGSCDELGSSRRLTGTRRLSGDADAGEWKIGTKT